MATRPVFLPGKSRAQRWAALHGVGKSDVTKLRQLCLCLTHKVSHTFLAHSGSPGMFQNPACSQAS